jgi:hypothetical protein
MAASLCVKKVIIDGEAVRKTLEHLFALLGLILFVVHRVSLVFLESPLSSSIRVSVNKLLDLHRLASHVVRYSPTIFRNPLRILSSNV